MIMKRDSETTRPLLEEGSKVLLKYIRGEIEGTDKVKIALSSCLIHSRVLATEANMEGNRLTLAKMIYTDPKEMERYVTRFMPQMIKKKLIEKEKK